MSALTCGFLEALLPLEAQTQIQARGQVLVAGAPRANQVVGELPAAGVVVQAGGAVDDDEEVEETVGVVVAPGEVSWICCLGL